MSNPCGMQNGGCSHLCLFRPKGYICACGDQPETDGQVPCSTGKRIQFRLLGYYLFN